MGSPHALLWSGTAESAVDLHPAMLLTFFASIANGIGGNQEVGVGYYDLLNQSLSHALLWTGTGSSVIDLHPSMLGSFDISAANDTNGQFQVGYISNSETLRQDAVLWTGTASSAVDLGLLLPFASTNSTALSIDEQGDIWGTAVDGSDVVHAVEWVPVPEPSAWILVTLGCFCFLAFRRRLRYRRNDLGYCS